MPAAGPADIVEAFVRERDGLRASRFLERQGTASGGVQHLNRGPLLPHRPQLKVGADCIVCAAILQTTQIARRFKDEWNEAFMQREIVRDVVERGGEHEDAALAD